MWRKIHSMLVSVEPRLLIYSPKLKNLHWRPLRRQDDSAIILVQSCWKVTFVYTALTILVNWQQNDVRISPIPLYVHFLYFVMFFQAFKTSTIGLKSPKYCRGCWLSSGISIALNDWLECGFRNWSIIYHDFDAPICRSSYRTIMTMTLCQHVSNTIIVRHQKPRLGSANINFWVG